MLRQETPSHGDLKQLAGVFQMLSDTTRLHIIMMLYDGERNVGSICQELGLPQPSVSHHLGLLLGNHLVKKHRVGRQIFYCLAEYLNMRNLLSQMISLPVN